MAFTFVHAADLHLDCPFDGLGEVSSELASTLRDATFTALDNIVRLCLSVEADFLVIAGDVYNSRDRSLRAQLKFRAALGWLAEAGVASYVVCGNHDSSDGWSASLDWPKEVHFFSSLEPESRPVIRNGNEIARVHGISYAKPGITDNLANRFSRELGSPFAIGLLHCNCGLSTVHAGSGFPNPDPYANHEPYAPCTAADLARSGFDYWALGHIHKGGVLLDSGPVVAYSGNPQGLNPKETGPKGCYVVRVGDDGSVKLDFAETDAVRWFDEELNIAGFTREQELIEALGTRAEQIRREARRPALVRFRLTGRTPLHHNLARKGMLDDVTANLRDGEANRESFVWVESICDATRPDVNIEERRQSEDFLGDFLWTAQEARSDPEKLAELRVALEPLFDYARGRAHLARPSDEQLLEWLDAAETYGLDALYE